MLSSFPRAKIIHIDFLNIPMGNDLGDPAMAPVQFEDFGQMLSPNFLTVCVRLGSKLEQLAT